MSNRIDKPKESAAALVCKMRDELGVTFRYTTEREAEDYLTDVNNYMRVGSYRKNYQKALRGPDTGKYVHLDFACLQELAVLDMHFRFLVQRMCSDIEHALKVKLIAEIEKDETTDGYDIVKQFLQQNPVIVRKIESTVASPFTTDLIHKYFLTQKIFNETKGRYEIRIIDCSDCPAWVLLELLTFGDFLYFYDFYASGKSKIPRNILNMVKSIRNAAAHNNCILADLNRGNVRIPKEIDIQVQSFRTISNHTRKAKLSSRPMAEFAALLYVYDLTVCGKVRQHRTEELKTFFFGRMQEKKNLFRENELIQTTYDTAIKMVEGFFGN